jgi:hypothetical protein
VGGEEHALPRDAGFEMREAVGIGAGAVHEDLEVGEHEAGGGGVAAEGLFETEVLRLEAVDAGACFMLADLKPLMDRAGPDAYRLAHLEAGIAGQRMFLAAHALGVGCTGIGPCYDDETVNFLAPEPSGWDVIYSVVLGVTKNPDPSPR